MNLDRLTFPIVQISLDLTSLDEALETAAIAVPDYVIAAPEQEDNEEVTAFNPVIIAEATTSLKQLSVSEAVTQLDMTGAPVMVFRHAGHGRVNLVYRRPDGNIGWIDPPAIPAGSH